MQASSWVLAQDHDETNMPAGRGGYSGEDKDDNYVECRSVAQIYQYGSADGVECRVCSSTMTSGSWRRGWRIELRLEEEGTLKDEDRPLYANLCNRCVFFVSSIAAALGVWLEEGNVRMSHGGTRRLFDHPRTSPCVV